MSRLGAGEQLDLAAQGITVGVLSNTTLKLLIALLLGRGTYRKVAVASLLLLGAAGCVGLWLR
jgi:hypothetical protein